MKKTIWITGAVAVVLAAGAYWWWAQRAAVPEETYRTAAIERGDLLATVSATGTVNPVKQVSVGTQVSGQIKGVYADFNDTVQAGQLIAEIDPETFEYRVRSAQADLDAARSAVLTAEANAAVSRANVSRAQNDLAEAERNHQRNLNLSAQGFISQSEVDRVQALLNSAREGLKAAQAQLGVSTAQIQSARASVAQREAVLAQSRIDLGRTQIKSPVNGIVIKRTVERGQTVAASLQAPELFVIAQNLSDMQVDANIDEADVGRIRAGQKVSFTVDAFPGQTYEGTIQQVRKAAQNVSNVVTYVAVVAFANQSGRLLPGMTANVRVVTDTRQGVLKVPNAALRVRLPGTETDKAEPSVPASSADSRSNGGAAMTAFRDRLVSELSLTPAQTEKVDAIYAAARPKFMELRDLPEDQRGKARERVLADVRARIDEVLTGDQKPRYAALVAETVGRRQTTSGRLYLLGPDGKPQAVKVRLGISDGASTELVLPNNEVSDALTEGAVVVTGLRSAVPPTRSSGTSVPRLPF